MAMTTERPNRMSVHNAPQIKPPGYLPRLVNGGRGLAVNTLAWQGRSWECDPRQLALTLATGNHPHAQVTRLSGPKLFWDSINSNRTGEGLVLGRFMGEPGRPTGPVEWQPISATQVPSRLGGVLARISSEFGFERGLENIVAHRVEGRDVIVSHVSKGQDRRLIVVNPDGWTGKTPERESLIEQLDRIPVADIERSELSPDGTTLTLTSRIMRTDGRPYEFVLDISSLKLNPKGVYSNPEDRELSVKIIAIDPLEDFENLAAREKVTIFYNQAYEITSEAVVRGFKEDDGTVHVVIDPMIYEQTGSAFLRATLQDDGSREISVITRDEVIKIKGSTEAEIRGNQTFLGLEQGLQGAVLRTFQASAPIEVKGKSQGVLLARLEQLGVSKEVLKAAKRIVPEVYNLNNFHIDRVKELRPRYALQFYKTRESRVKNALDSPLKEGEQVVITKVKSAAEIVHLDETNGRKRGDREIIPLNFDPTHGHPEDYSLVRLDPRPHAMMNTTFGSSVDTAIAGQHLIDPYVMGTEIMAAVWPKVDQLGFFGVFMQAAMAFPHGMQFVDPKNNPWYLRSFGTISHSIFDAKSDAGRTYNFFSGGPRFSKEVVGAAMVTGPNTDTFNPVREGRLFNCRLPGRTGVIKTAIPGFYIMVIEDAESSYYFMTMFGLKTETTILPLSAGGGLDNYQLALTIQRSQRWNAGKDIYLMDAALNMYLDGTRATAGYRQIYNHTRGLWMAEADISAGIRRDALGALMEPERLTAAEKPASLKAAEKALDPNRPLQKMYKLNEAREWLNVGTWYFVAAAKLISYLSVPTLVLTQLLPIPVAGVSFLFACLATTVFSWPAWAIQMAKVGVNPKTILSLSPVHLFWGDLPMHTMLKSGLDVERLGLGKFRISDRKLGNRIPARDKRTAFWAGLVAPTAFGAALVGSAALMTYAIGLAPLAITAAPFLVGLGLSRLASGLAKKWLPNPNSRSFGRSLVHFAAKNLPLIAGITGSALLAPSFAVYAIPLSLAIMAGGWSIFMGANIFNEFLIYHNEQKKQFAMPAPNPPAGTIREYQADTWRNTIREAFGFAAPSLLPYEFTKTDNPNIDPDKLWEAVSRHTTNLLAKPGPDTLVNCNNLINGEGDPPVVIDLYEELRHLRPPMLDQLDRAQVRWFDPISWPDLFTRRGKIAGLERATRKDRELIAGLRRDQRVATDLHISAKQYDRIRELNRLVLEETFPEYTPRQ